MAMKKLFLGMLLVAFGAFTVSAHEVGLTSDFDQNDQVVTVDGCDVLTLDQVIVKHNELFDDLVTANYGYRPMVDKSTLVSSQVLTNTHNLKAILVMHSIPIDKGKYLTVESTHIQNKLIKESRLSYRTKLFKSSLFHVKLE